MKFIHPRFLLLNTVIRRFMFQYVQLELEALSGICGQSQDNLHAAKSFSRRSLLYALLV